MTTMEGYPRQQKLLKPFDVIRYAFRKNDPKEAVVIQTEKGINVCHIIANDTGTIRLGLAGTIQSDEILDIIGHWTIEQVEDGLVQAFGESESSRELVRRHLAQAALQQAIVITVAQQQ